jgi:hypothetical protein
MHRWRRRFGTMDVPAPRTFEELGMTIDGVEYGHFTGEARQDAKGSHAADHEPLADSGVPP